MRAKNLNVFKTAFSKCLEVKTSVVTSRVKDLVYAIKVLERVLHII